MKHEGASTAPLSKASSTDKAKGKILDQVETQSPNYSAEIGASDNTMRKVCRRLSAGRISSPMLSSGNIRSLNENPCPSFKRHRTPADLPTSPSVDTSYEFSIFEDIQSFLKDQVNRENLVQVAPGPLLKAVECCCSIACLVRFELSEFLSKYSLIIFYLHVLLLTYYCYFFLSF